MELGTLSAQLQQVLDQLQKHDSKISELGRDIGKVRSRVRSQKPASASVEPSDSDDQAHAPAAVTHDDLEAAMRLGEMRAKLPEHARARIAKMQADGRSLADQAMMAEALLESLGDKAPAKGAGTAGDPPVPTGAAATSAPRTSPAHPKSLSEYKLLRQKDPKRFEELQNDPSFDPGSLPGAVSPFAS